jgi:hypothetical protein
MVAYDTKLLSVPLRIARRATFPDIQRALCGLSLSRGGLGYRTWKSTADCAHLASYIHASAHIPAMFPALAQCFPPILTLVPKVGPVPAPPSQRAGSAARALVRLTASAPLLRERIENAKGPLRHTQHVLASAVDEAEAKRVTEQIMRSDNPDLPRHMELFLSNQGDPSTLGLVPSDPETTFPNDVFGKGFARRLLQSIELTTRSERRQCPSCHVHSDDVPGDDHTVHKVDAFGDHCVLCPKNLSARTTLWHDPLVRFWHRLFKMVGWKCGMEVSNLMLTSGKRPDVVRYMPTSNVLTDVRTIAAAHTKYCKMAACIPGHGADWGAGEKNDKWEEEARHQGDTFIPLCHEVGGRLGEPAKDLVDLLARSAGVGPEREAFKTYALQRLRALTFSGVARIILARPPFRTGPEVPPARGALPLASPPPRPAHRGRSSLASPVPVHGPATGAGSENTTTTTITTLTTGLTRVRTLLGVV